MSLSTLFSLTVSQCYWGPAWTCALFPVTWVSLGSCELSLISYSGTGPLSSALPFPFLWFLSPRTTYQFSWAQESCLCITQALQGRRLERPLWFHQLDLLLPWWRMLCQCVHWDNPALPVFHDTVAFLVGKPVMTLAMAMRPSHKPHHWGLRQIFTSPLNLNSCFTIRWLDELRQATA